MKCAILLLLLMAPLVYAAPTFSGPVPEDGSYFGRGAINFSVNLTSSSLDTASVRLFVISEDAYSHGEPWDNYTMQCSQYDTDKWECKRTVSFSIAGSDTLEFYYVEATDGSGTGSTGSASSPVRFRIDRTPPLITFVNPLDNSFVSGNVTVEITASDIISGVNQSTLEYSFGSGWTSDNILYTAAYSDNSIVNISVRISDNVGNSGTSSILVRTDNTPPQLTILSPSEGEQLNGVKIFSINVTDALSGINQLRVTYDLGSQQPMSCQSNTCSSGVNTKAYADGNYSVLFTAYDNASNSNTASAQVSLKNTVPLLTLVPEGYISGTITINASITNPAEIISSVNLSMAGPRSSNMVMSCNAGFTQCSYLMDTTQFDDGRYALTAVASNNLGYDISDAKWITVDNSNPDIVIDTPDLANGPLVINVRIGDTAINKNNVTIEILGETKIMTCVQQDNTLYCTSQYDFTHLHDGKYDMTVKAVNMVGKLIVKTKSIMTDKNPPEFRSLRLEPLNPGAPSGVKMTVIIVDELGVKSVSASIINPSLTSSLDLNERSGTWQGVFYASSVGPYDVNINAEDINGNSKTFKGAGYFYVGQTTCGDDVCEYYENYCLCPADCQAPCASPDCSSGLPVCSLGKCGDGTCSADESCSSCRMDCGECKTEESKYVNPYPLVSDMTLVVTALSAAAVVVVVLLNMRRKKIVVVPYVKS